MAAVNSNSFAAAAAWLKRQVAVTRILKKPGDLFSFPLSTNGAHGYAQWLNDGTARVFLISSATAVPIEKICAAKVAFRVLVFKDTPGRYGWVKVGKGPVPDEYSAPQRYAKKDKISGAISVYFQGVETPASIEELKGLESAAVWVHPHIVERLEAQLAGRPSSFAKAIAIAT